MREVDTGENSNQNQSMTGSTCIRSRSQISDLPDASVQKPNLQCRPKVTPRKPEISFEASPEFVDTFECEEFQEDSEAEKKDKWLNCSKNPGHHDFIPVKDFTLEHLPEAYRNQTYLKGIKSLANVTARLKVNYTSKDRPQGYFLAKLGGTRLPHTGTGFVYPCFFAEEVKSIELSASLMDSGRKDQGLEDHFKVKYDGNEDDKEFQNGLERMSGRKKKSSKTVIKVARGVKDFFDLVSDYKDDSNSSEDDKASGFFGPSHVDALKAPVVELMKSGRTDILGNSLMFMPFLLRGRQRTPRKCEKDYKRLNKMKRCEKMLKKVSSLIGQFSAHSKSSGTHCKSSKGHLDGDDVKDTDHGDDDDDDFRVDTSDSDCEDDVSYSDTVSDEDDEDELENYVDDLDKFNECDLRELEDPEEDINESFGVLYPCGCPECQTSKNPNPKGYYFNVLTARHVVFDKEEAKNTVVDLFCDDDSEAGMARLFGIDVHLFSPAGDLVILMCATHNIKLVYKLRLLIVDMMDRIDAMKQKSDTPLTIICSHPHGNFKHVTVGEWVQRDIYRRLDGQSPCYTSYLYNTPTCPGSSGAPVVILGHKEGTLLMDSQPHPHHGSHNDWLNKSGRHLGFDTDLSTIGPKGRKRLLQEQREVRRKIRKEMATKSNEERKMLKTILNPLINLNI